MSSSVDTVVADAGPLIALARIDCLRLLPAPFAGVLTTAVVIAEATALEAYPEGAKIQAAVQLGSIALESPDLDRPSWGLDAGEASVLRLALRKGCGVLMDDRAGRRVAARAGIPVIGVLGTLLLLKRSGKVARLRPLAESLIASGYYIGDQLLAEACNLAGEDA